MLNPVQDSGPSRRAMLGIAVLALGAMAASSLQPASAETGVSKDTIKIGMYGPLTGAVSIYGYPINNGAVAIYNETNEQGGINGRKIEIVHEDGGCDPAKTRAAVKKLIHRDEVFMVHGGSCSAAVFAARDEFVENKVPHMVMAATMDKISEPANRYVFTTTLPGSADGRIMLNFSKTIPNAKRMAIIKHDNEWAGAKAKDIYAGYAAAGFELVADVSLESKATDATSQVLKIKEAKPDVTMFVLYPGESAVFLRDSLKYGLSGPFIGTTAVMDLKDLATRAGSEEAVEDVYVGAFLRGPIGSAELQQWTDLYKRHFPDDKIQSLSFYGMSGALTVVEALRKAGPDPTREKFVDALESIKNGEGGPATCSVSFSPEKHQGCIDGVIWTLDKGEIVNIGQSWRQ